MENNQLTAPQLTMEIIKDSQYLKCECGGIIFTEKMLFKRISAIVSPTGNAELYPLPIYVCDACGKIPQQMDPTNMIPIEFKSK